MKQVNIPEHLDKEIEELRVKYHKTKRSLITEALTLYIIHIRSVEKDLKLAGLREDGT